MNQLPYVPVQANSKNFGSPGRYLERKPAAELRKLIYCYWYTAQIEASKKEWINSTEMIVPDGCIDIVFRINRFSPDIQILVIGTVDRAQLVNMEYDRIDTFGIRFFPGGLQSFILEPASLFTNRMVNLSDVANGFANDLRDLFYGNSSIDELVCRMDRYLLARVSNNLAWENTFRNALGHIYQAKGNIPIKEIASREAISEKQLTRIFYDRVGVGTKAFSRIVRFQQMLGLLNSNEKITITQAAMLSGYYDQAHCIREFQDFCSILPSDYLKSRM